MATKKKTETPDEDATPVASVDDPLRDVNGNIIDLVNDPNAAERVDLALLKHNIGQLTPQDALDVQNVLGIEQPAA